jgi:hypothetical protein
MVGTAFVNVKNRDLSHGGVNTDMHPVELPLNTFTDALNVRFSAGSALTRKADLSVMGKPPAVPINLSEVDGKWYWGSDTKLWEYGQDQTHRDVSRLDYSPTITNLGATTDPIVFKNGISYDNNQLTFETSPDENTVGVDILVGDIFNGLTDPLINFTVASVINNNVLTFTTNAVDETEFRLNFAYPIVFQDDGDLGEIPPIAPRDHVVGDVASGYEDGIDWFAKKATFLGGGVPYEGSVGIDVIIGTTFTGAAEGNPQPTMVVTSIIDINSFTFSTNLPTNESAFREAFANPVVFNGPLNLDPEEPLVPGEYTFNVGQYWEFTPFGSTMVASNQSNTPQIRTPNLPGQAGESFYDIPGWGLENVDNDFTSFDPILWRTKVVRSYKQFLVAVNMVIEGSNPPIHLGGTYPHRVRWSSAALPGQAPASWNGATLETNAGWVDLADITGELIEGIKYRDSFLLFTESEIVEMKFIGGNEIFSFKKIFDDGGLLSRNCAVEFKGKQFCVGPNDIYVHDTSTKTSVANDVVKDRLFREISQTDTDNVQVVHNEIDDEIWILYSSRRARLSGNYPLDKVAVWDYVDMTWSFFTLRNASGISSGVRPPLDIDLGSDWVDMEASGVRWSDADLPWSGRGSGFGNQGLVYSSYGSGLQNDTGGFYQADYLTASNTSPERFLEKVGIDVSQVAQGEVDRWCSIKRILPVITTFEGATVRFLVTGSEQQHESPRFFNEETGNVAIGVDEYIFTPSSDYKVDIRQTWSYMAIRIEFLDNVAYEVHSLDMDVTSRGRR